MQGAERAKTTATTTTQKTPSWANGGRRGSCVAVGVTDLPDGSCGQACKEFCKELWLTGHGQVFGGYQTSTEHELQSQAPTGWSLDSAVLNM